MSQWVNAFFKGRLRLLDLKFLRRDLFNLLALGRRIVNKLSAFHNLRFGFILGNKKLRAAMRALAELPFQGRRTIELVAVRTQEHEDIGTRLRTAWAFLDSAAQTDIQLRRAVGSSDVTTARAGCRRHK